MASSHFLPEQEKDSLDSLTTEIFSELSQVREITNLSVRKHISGKPTQEIPSPEIEKIKKGIEEELKEARKTSADLMIRLGKTKEQLRMIKALAPTDSVQRIPVDPKSPKKYSSKNTREKTWHKKKEKSKLFATVRTLFRDNGKFRKETKAEKAQIKAEYEKQKRLHNLTS